MSPPATLAYVFWHWMGPDQSVGEYEDALRAFQEVLAANAPEGFRRAAVYRQGSLPWLPQAGAGYVDWYVIDGSAAMDPLNDAAISAACRATHDAAAARAVAGTAGLYGLRAGAAAARQVDRAAWFPKPAGMTYEALDALLSESRGEGAVLLWSRRMTLGPGPEFCLLGAAPLAIPDALDALEVPMTLVWPNGHDATPSEGPLG